MARPRNLRTALPGLWRTVVRFGPYIRAQRLLITGGTAALLTEVCFRLLEPWPLKFVLDRVLAGTGADAPAGSGIRTAPGGLTGVGWADRIDPVALLAVSAVAVAVLTGARALSSYLSTVAFALAGNRVLTSVRAELYRHLQRLSLRYHDHTRGGDLITRLTGDVGRLQEITVTAALPLVGNVVTFAGMLAVMMWLDPGLTAIALAAFPAFGLTMVRLSRRIRAVSRKQRMLEGQLASVAAESFTAMRVVQSYSLERALERQFESSNDRSMKDGVKAKRLAAALERRTDVLVAVATGLVLYFGARRVLAGALTAGDLVVFLTYLKNAFKPLRDFAKYTGRLAKAAASGERIVDVLDTAPDIRDGRWAREAHRFRGDVRLEGLRFGYDPERPVLAGLDLHVRPGQHVALVGPSGAGKSSLVSLLPRLYDPQQGRILVDGVDIREFTLASLRGQIALVLQDSVLFAASVRENIAHGAPGATAADVERAARLANAHEFITALPEGYDTVLSERGTTLSGGQRQRIAIARAAVRDAPIIVLDEPTAGLDEGNAAEVTAALTGLTRGRTTFLVAHDLRTVIGADRIIHLEHGRVTESGTHAQLLAAGGGYALTYRSQTANAGGDRGPVDAVAG